MTTAVDDVDKELLGTRRLLEDPDVPPDFLEAAHARVDERFCERPRTPA